jgi:S-adenosylmethionine synthetase
VLRDDPSSHVACETFLTTGLVVVGGEITTKTYVDIPSLVRRVLSDIGYDQPELGFHFQDCAVLSVIKEQSKNIADAVGNSSEKREGSKDPLNELGAGDQGIMFGYARSDTETLMPLTIHLAHRLAQRMAVVRKDKTVPFLRPDGKTQVTVEYEGDRPLRVDTVLLAAQHEPGVMHEDIERELLRHVVEPVLGPWLDARTHVLINTSGQFVIGGPASDSGVTGRKIIVDTYGGFSSHGGGAFSGKDPTKVDRTGAYMARYVAKNLVAANLAREVEVEIAYAIGRAAPLAVNVQTYGTGTVSDERLRDVVLKTFDLRPKAIIDAFDLLRPIYEPLSAYGHFGRTDLDLPWERTDKADRLARASR